MRIIKTIALLGLFACAQLQAASFDCEQARSTSEKLICNDEKLSELDAQLEEAYRTAKENASTEKARRLKGEQFQWLRNIRNRCVDAACLLKVYESRLNELDPFADKQITCEEMKKFPELVFSGGIDLGSGSGSPIDVDYRCRESLDQQGFMLKLLDLAEKIRGDNGPQLCTGSIVHAQWRYYHFSLAEAGFSPRTLSRDLTSVRTGMDWNSFAQAEGTDDDSRTISYFKQWSEQSLFNHDLYQEFVSEVDRVLPQLVKHYERKLELSKQDAKIAAGGVLRLVVQRAAGGFPRSELQPDSVLVRLVRDEQVTSHDIQSALNGNKGDPARHSENEMYQALVVALIKNRPLQIVSSMSEMLAPEALQRLGEGKEPLLSFAIGSQENLEYLISRKTPVNAANDFGKTALFYAIGSNNHKAAEALVRAGADVNHAYKSAKELRPDDDECTYFALAHTRRTPLMHAAQHSDVQMLKMLVQAKARLNAADDLGYNALDYAVLGKNKDNETYLKSLGLEFGAPKYSSAPDPAVREQTITETIAIDGYVSKLLTAPGRPDLLVASVHPWDTLVAGPSHGLYLISIADPDHPKVISNFSTVYANDFALSPDGKRAYVMETANKKSLPEKKFGLSIIDITDPKKPILAERIEGDFMTMHLAPDGKLLYIQERALKPGFSRGLLVYSIEPNGARIRCDNPFGNVEFHDQVFAYSFTSFPDEPLLLIQDRSRKLILFGVKDPCMPIRLAEIRTENVGGPMYGIAGRTIISSTSDELQKFRITDTLVRVAGYQATVHVFHMNAATGNITAVIDKDVAIFRTKASGQFVLTDRFHLPTEYVGSVLQTDNGHIYAGWKGGLGVGLISRN